MRSEENNLRLSTAVKNQYIYKLRANSGYFCALVLAQVIAGLMMFAGSAATGTAIDNVQIMFYTISPQIAVIFSVIWALIISILLTTHANRDIAFTVTGNRKSYFLSDIAFILTGCVFGGVTSALIGVALRVPFYFLHMGNVMLNGFYPNLGQVCIIAASTMLYMLLLAVAGYFAGTLLRFRKVFIIIAAALFVGIIYLRTNLGESQSFLRMCWDSIINEKLLGFFTLRVTAVSIVMFAVTVALSYRMEVRK